MPVKSNFNRRKVKKSYFRSERSAKSLSPQKSNIVRDPKNIKNNSVDSISAADNDLLSSQSDNSYSSLLKQLHSDFNKKYISDNVTMDTKLRWKRDLQVSPSRSEDASTPRSILLSKVKRSPQIPSPLYSPIKPRRKLKERNKQSSPSMSFETPPSSSESESPKLSKQRKKNISESANCTSPVINLKQKDLTETHSKKNGLRSAEDSSVDIPGTSMIMGENCSNKKLITRRTGKSVLSDENAKRKNKVKESGTAESSLQYFIEEEHYNMENVLETESEKSDFPATRSPTSVSLGIVSTPSPDTPTVEEVTDPLYFLQKSKKPIRVRSKSLFSRNISNVEKNGNSMIFIAKSNAGATENEKSNNDNCLDVNDVDSSGVITKNKLGMSDDNCDENLFEQKQNEMPSCNFELQENLNPLQNNEAFHYPALHNRVTSLKSPMSMDSAHGSSIDVETNYHPKHCEIFWGRKGNFPYWPCLIWPDPEGKTVRIEKHSHKQYISYHVKFFADNGQRSWIYKDNLIAYNGREDFERRSKEQSLKMKSSLFKKCFVVSRAKLPIWDQAVKEADKILAVHIEKRPEKFNEILKESMELLKMHKQQRRLSLSIERSSSLINEELLSINDSNEDLLNTSGISSSLSTVSKRRRSSSLYENLAKRHKNEFESEDFIQRGNLNAINTNSNKYLFPKELIDVMADYALKTTEEEESFQRFENCCIELFRIAKDSINEEYYKNANVKKHPNRLLRKNLMSRLKKHYAQIFSNPSQNIEKIKQKRAVLNVPPIQAVLRDIVDLLNDKQYLFRNLKKVAVCKVCLKPNSLFKCSGYCDSWIHKECCNFTPEEYLGKVKLENRRKRAKKMSTKKKDDETHCVHITGDEDIKYISTKKQELDDGENQLDSITVETHTIPEKVTCKQCLTYIKPFCAICKACDHDHDSTLHESSNSELLDHSDKILLKCKLNTCNRYYHLPCLKLWPQTYITKTKDSTNKGNSYVEKIDLLCPSHTCHTCVSEDPHHIQLGKNNIIKCVKCPATYHSHSKCIPAGTQFLTANIIVCPRHDEKIKPTNTDWCFLCSQNGDLICCDTCPSSFHLSCLKLTQAPKDKFLCELCRNGCLPLYGDLVWCKFSSYKWWPSVIIPPPIIPKNISNKPHLNLGFCVRFLGTNDYGWTGRHRVYLYQEDDYSPDRKRDKILQKAIDEAKMAWDYFEINKPKRFGIEDDSTPLPYKKIKNNLPVPPVKLEYNISELNPCNCLPDDNSPCGFNSQCLNRVLMIECNPKICPAKLNCENQMFEKRQYAPVAIRKTTGKGFGLVCTAPIAEGAFIIEYVGELIDDEELKRRIEEKQKEKDSHYYFFSIESNLTIDAGPKGNLARFMNHSCEPNCEPQMWTVNGVKRIGLFAKYDIKEETELTFHYNFECIGDNKILCHCGAENCSGFIGGIYNKKSNEVRISSQEKDNKVIPPKIMSSKTVKIKQVQEK
ncbi:nuclear receptor binding SET domain protein isoform X2 [Condylostylus longicornis]|uniref:nuclear receptor binding SET domain protein isoform X2 n=1 Tax=Condylostylus longicornis TaxID=2530218 RepID=UPI00244DA328|nr:nuclear receptor binding SET domain protein isoform X2 [Condylostylus longicornis]